MNVTASRLSATFFSVLRSSWNHVEWAMLECIHPFILDSITTIIICKHHSLLCGQSLCCLVHKFLLSCGANCSFSCKNWNTRECALSDLSRFTSSFVPLRFMFPLSCHGMQRLCPRWLIAQMKRIFLLLDPKWHPARKRGRNDFDVAETSISAPLLRPFWQNCGAAIDISIHWCRQHVVPISTTKNYVSLAPRYRF